MRRANKSCAFYAGFRFLSIVDTRRLAFKDLFAVGAAYLTIHSPYLDRKMDGALVLFGSSCIEKVFVPQLLHSIRIVLCCSCAIRRKVVRFCGSFYSALRYCY